MKHQQTMSVQLPAEYRDMPSDVSMIMTWSEDNGMYLKDFTRLPFEEQREIAIGKLGLNVDRLIAALAWANGFQKAINDAFCVAMFGSREPPNDIQMV